MFDEIERSFVMVGYPFSFFRSAMFCFYHTEVANIATTMYSSFEVYITMLIRWSIETKRVTCLDSLQTAHSVVAARMFDLTSKIEKLCDNEDEGKYFWRI